MFVENQVFQNKLNKLDKCVCWLSTLDWELTLSGVVMRTRTGNTKLGLLSAR